MLKGMINDEMRKIVVRGMEGVSDDDSTEANIFCLARRALADLD